MAWSRVVAGEAVRSRWAPVILSVVELTRFSGPMGCSIEEKKGFSCLVSNLFSPL